MKRLNVKLLVILIVGSAVAIGGAVGLWNFQMIRHSGNALKRANIAYDSGEFAEAIDDLERYLGLNPHDGEQIVRLAMWRGEWLNKGGLIQPAFVHDSYMKAIDVDDDNRELRQQAAEFDMKHGLWQDAVSHWKKIQEMEGEGGSVETRVALAEAYFYSDLSNRDTEAAKLLTDMIGLQADGTLDEEAATAPGNAKAYQIMSQLFRERRLDLATAEAIMQAAVERNPNSSEIQLAYSQYLASTDPPRLDEESRKKRREASIAAAERAFELDPNSSDVILRAAIVKAQGGELREADEILTRGLEQYPDVINFYFILAEVKSLQGEPEAGLKVIKQGLLEMQDNIDLVNKKFTLEIQLGDADAARQTLDVLRRLNMPSEIRQFYEGEIAFVQQNYAKAREIYEQVRPMMDRNQAQFANFANTIDSRLLVCYDTLSLPDLQLATLERMARTNGSPEIIRRMAVAWQLMGRADLAERRLDALMGLEQFEELPQAAQIREQAVRLKTERMMRLPEERRDWTEIDALLDQVAPADSEEPNLLALRSSNLRLRGEAEAATALLARGIELDPNNETLWLTRIREVAAEGEHERALSHLDRFEAEHGESAASRGTRGAIYAMIGGEEMQEKLQELEEGVEDWDEIQRLGLWEQLSGAHLSVKSWRTALDLLGRVAEARPQLLAVRMRMFDIAMQAGDEAAMVSSLKLIEDLVGTGDSNWELQEARRQIWLHKNDQGEADALARARRLVEQVQVDRPRWHVNARTQAELAMLEGQEEAAIDYLEAALSNGPRDLAVVQNLAELLMNHERINEARNLLNNIGKEELNDPLRRLQLVLDADDARKNGETSTIRARVDELVSIDSEDANDVLFRARMLASLEDSEAAEAAFRRAVELAPAAPVVWLQLVSFLAQEGRIEEAEQVVHSAQMRIPETLVPMTMGQMYVMLGNYAWAELYCKMAFDTNPESLNAQRTMAAFYLAANRIDNATPYLNQILQSVDPEAESTPAEVKWARREVAKIFAGRGSYQDYLTAVKLIQENAPEGEMLEDSDLALLASLALSRPETLSRRQAIELIEQRRQRPDPTPDGVLLNLAKLYNSTNATDESRDLTLELSRRYPDNENIIAFYIQILREQEDLAELDTWINRLDSESYAYIELQSLMLAERGKVEEAVEVIREGLFPEGLEIDAYAPEDQGRFRTGALLLTRIARYDESQYETAEYLLKQFVDNHRGYVLMLPAFLGARGGEENLARAFEIMQEERGNTVATIQVTQTAVGILRANQDTISTDSPYYELVDSWFEIGEEESPNNRSLVIQRAGFEEFRGEFDAALRHYRRSLEMGELDFGQRALVNNNMAYLMALQGECKEPRELVEESMAAVGPIATLLDTRAMTYIACGQARQAVDDLNQAQLDGEEPVFQYHLALAHDLAENSGLAKEKLERAIELGLLPESLLRPEQVQFAELMKKYNIDESTLKTDDN